MSDAFEQDLCNELEDETGMGRDEFIASITMAGYESIVSFENREQWYQHPVGPSCRPSYNQVRMIGYPSFLPYAEAWAEIKRVISG